MSTAGPVKKAGAKRLTPTERKIIAFVAEHEGEPCSKSQIAEVLGRNQKTIDRLVAHLREEGLLVSTPVWDKNGAQLANTYRLARNRASKSVISAARAKA